MSQKKMLFENSIFPDQSGFKGWSDILTHAPIGIFISTPEGRFISANPALAEIFGYNTPEEMMESITDIPSQIYHDPGERAKFEDAIRQKGEVINYEYHLLRRDGSRFWASSYVRAVRDKKGKILYYQGFMTDITQRKQEEEHRKFQLRFQRIVADASAAFNRVTSDREFDRTVDSTLQRMGEIFAVDRSYLFQFSADMKRITNTHEWCAPEIEPQMHRLQDQSTDELPWWKEKMFKREPVYIPDIEGLPPEAQAEKEHFQSQDIRSIISVPTIGTHVQMSGFLGFDAVKTLHHWTDEQITMLQIVADIIGNTLERRRTEQALQESSKEYRRLFENAPMGIFQTTPRGRLLLVNPEYARIFGYDSPSEMIGQITNIAGQLYVDPKERDQYMEILSRQGYVSDFEAQLRRRNKENFWVSMNTRVRQAGSGKVIYDGFLTDITERKQAENKLRESEKRYREILDSIEDGYFECDLSGTIAFCNPATARLIGYRIEECVGLNFRDICVYPEKVFHLFNRVLKTRRSEPGVVLELLRKNGSHGFAETSISPIINLKGRVTGFRGLGRDITERKRAAEEREKLQAQLVQAQKMESVGMLAGGIAHDFNNLLHAISGNLELLGRDKPLDHPDQKRLQTIRRSIDRGSDLVQHLLLFSRKAEIKKQALDLNLEIRHTARILERSIPRMVKIELYLEDKALPIFADPVQVEQVLFNLGTNAADAMPEGGRLIIETENIILDQGYARTHAGAKPGRYVLMSVTDTGCGMDKKTRDQVFDPFFTTKEVGKGTGLGLASVYGIVKAHEGYILCYSEPGQGTAFRIYWPASPEMIVLDQDARDKDTFEGGSENILVVDDEEDIRELTVEALQDHGYQTFSAASGEQALEIYSRDRESIDLVVLDLNMPGMGGSRCLEEILKINPGAKALIASGYSASAQAGDVLSKGAAGFIGKPFQVHELLARVREVLDKE
jgi:two-component system, cell cycle sensor histidine kinase and response regulator CckA